MKLGESFTRLMGSDRAKEMGEGTTGHGSAPRSRSSNNGGRSSRVIEAKWMLAKAIEVRKKTQEEIWGPFIDRAMAVEHRETPR